MSGLFVGDETPTLWTLTAACQPKPAHVLSFLVGEILTHVSDRITDAACRTFSLDFETMWRHFNEEKNVKWMGNESQLQCSTVEQVSVELVVQQTIKTLTAK